MKRTIFILLACLAVVGGAVGLYVSRYHSDWDGFDPSLLNKSLSIREVLTSPKRYLNQPVVLRTNWIAGVEGAWLADDLDHSLGDDSSMSFRWMSPDVYRIYSEKGVSLSTYPVFLPPGPILAVGIFRVGDFNYGWGTVPNKPHLELEKVYLDVEKTRARNEN